MIILNDTIATIAFSEAFSHFPVDEILVNPFN